MSSISKKGKAEDAWKILNGFVGDLAVASRTLSLFATLYEKGKIQESTKLAARRMCLSHLFLALTKWLEFYKSYQNVIPSDCQQLCKELRRQLQKRPLKTFRNKQLGHIWDKKTSQPMDDNVIELTLSEIFNNNEEGFLEWVNDFPRGNVFPETIVSIIEHTRDRIDQQYGLGKSPP